ncbi:MAG: GGDEF domain-containing protein [Candidatus Dormibacteria bacterium]
MDLTKGTGADQEMPRIDDRQLKLSYLIGSEPVQAAIENFRERTGLELAALGMDGIGFGEPVPENEHCRILRALGRCGLVNPEVDMPAHPDSPELRICHGSIAHLVMPLALGDEHVGRLVSQPFSAGALDMDEMIQFAEAHGAHPDNLANGAMQLSEAPARDVAAAGRLAALVANAVVGNALQRQDQVALVQAFDQLTLALNQEVVGEMILQLALRLMRLDAGLVLVQPSSGDQVRYESGGGDEPWLGTLMERAAERCQKTKNPFSVPDLSTSIWAQRLVRDASPQGSVLAAPIRRGDDTMGAVAVYSPRSRSDVEGDLHKLVLLGTQAAVSLQMMSKLVHSQERAERDDLTGLYNRRFFKEQLAREMSRAARYGHELALMVLDIDNFKTFNDDFGHHNGDHVIRSVADVLESTVRKTNTVARYGGDEFCVIVPEGGLAAAEVVATRIREAVQELKLVDDEGQPMGGVSVSLGVSEYDAEKDNPLTFFARTDQNLLMAKREGRDRVVSA